MVAVAAAAGVAGFFAVPFVIGALGFGAAGVLSGSIAAGVQSGIGNVAAGSSFAALQSAGAAGVATSSAAAAGAGAAATAGGVASSYDDDDNGGGISTKSGAFGGFGFIDIMIPYLCAVAGDYIYEKIFYKYHA